MAEQMLGCPPVSPPNRVVIVIAAEQALFRDGLRSLLETEWQLSSVLEAGSGSDLALDTTKLQPDLLVLDLAYPDVPAPDVLRKLAAKVPVIVLWDERNRADHEAVRDLGIWRSIDKRLGATALLDAIRPVLTKGRNRTDASDFGLSDLPAALSVTADPYFGLTRRERQILAAVASAFPNREIARRLAITEDTVKRHLTSIFDKVGVSNRVELTLFAVHHGLVDGSLSLEKPAAPPRVSRSLRRIIPWRQPLIGTR